MRGVCENVVKVLKILKWHGQERNSFKRFCGPCNKGTYVVFTIGNSSKLFARENEKGVHDSYISPRDYGIGDERGEGGCVPFFINNQKINLPAKRILIRSKGCKIRVEAMPPEIPASRCSYLPDNNIFFLNQNLIN